MRKGTLLPRKHTFCHTVKLYRKSILPLFSTLVKCFLWNKKLGAWHIQRAPSVIPYVATLLRSWVYPFIRDYAPCRRSAPLVGMTRAGGRKSRPPAAFPSFILFKIAPLMPVIWGWGRWNAGTMSAFIAFLRPRKPHVDQNDVLADFDNIL